MYVQLNGCAAISITYDFFLSTFVCSFSPSRCCSNGFYFLQLQICETINTVKFAVSLNQLRLIAMCQLLNNKNKNPRTQMSDTRIQSYTVTHTYIHMYVRVLIYHAMSRAQISANIQLISL